MLHRADDGVEHDFQPGPDAGLVDGVGYCGVGDKILHPDRGVVALLADLVVAVGEDAGREAVVEDGVVVVFFVAAVAGAAAVGEVVFEGYVCGGSRRVIPGNEG